MPVANMTEPDVREFRPSLVLSLWDGYTGASILEGNVTVKIGQASPLFQKNGQAAFVFLNLANGSYTVNVASAPDEPYYLPANIPISLPLPATAPWPQPWTGYPNPALADPTKLLSDPDQTAAYLAQRQLATLQPTTSYPFPSGATLVRGTVTAAGVAVSGALVTTALMAQAGQFPVVVLNPNGAISSPQTVTVVTTPVIESLTPAMVIAGSAAFVMNVGGTGFDPGAVVKLSGTALPTTVLSATALTAQVPAAAAGSVGSLGVVVSNPDGTVSNQQMLTVAAAPAVNAITPATIAAGGAAFTLTVQGGGFASNTTVEINGSALATVFFNSTQLTAQVPAAQIAGAAQLSVTAVNPGPPQQVSNAQTLAVVSAPLINALRPATLVVGNPAFNLTVLGSGFVSGSTVQLNGITLTTEFVDATELIAQVTAAQVAAPGSPAITVTNPGGAVSSAQALAVAAAPAITSLAPGIVTADSAAFTLIVRGSGFVSGSIVQINGSALPTTFVSDGQLDAHVPRSGYTTGQDGTFVLFFDSITGLSQPVTLIVVPPGVATQKLQTVTLLRGATVSADIEIS